MKSRRVAVLVAAGLIAGLGYGLFVRVPPGPRSLRVFDPDRMADLELGMWQAYYAKENARLFGLLVTMLHEQNRYTWAKATLVGFHLARAAATFGNLKENYDQVLPDLEHAYSIERDWMNAGFDPTAVARAELAWWVARRIPEQSSVDNVGALISGQYSLFYETPVDGVARAGKLRAEAAALRDRGGQHADWPRVGLLLHDSYRDLHHALTSPAAVSR